MKKAKVWKVYQNKRECWAATKSGACGEVGGKMQEHTEKIVNKTILFETSGETISVQIKLEIASPTTKKEALSNTMDILFKEAKEAILS